MIIPIILVITVVTAGFFAFIPIENASSVHTTIMANTQRIDEIAVPNAGANLDLVITCPATSDGCRILEIFFHETDGEVDNGIDGDGFGDVDLGAVNAVINGARISVIQADLNTQVDESMQAIAGVSGVTIGGAVVFLIFPFVAYYGNQIMVIIQLHYRHQPQ